MSRRVFSAEQVNMILEPLISAQRQIANDVSWEYEFSDEAGSLMDHEILASREFERGRLAGMVEAASLLGRAYINGIRSL
ncbi:MAG: hypothetical protein R3330_09285 [Saprospiraceae bacterium]|nr:hypothetical protein [Saprospiraceae bacterium]